jgi:hypothetical protein
MVKNSLAVGRISLAANATASACHFSSQFSPAARLISFLGISIFAEKALIFYCIAFFVTLFAHRFTSCFHRLACERLDSLAWQLRFRLQPILGLVASFAPRCSPRARFPTVARQSTVPTSSRGLVPEPLLGVAARCDRFCAHRSMPPEIKYGWEF